MMEKMCWLYAVAAVLAAYLIGSIPFGYLIGKSRGIDVRTVGSKNIGATNVYRTVGKKWGFLAFFCDFLKGLVPTLVALKLTGNHDFALIVGLACVIGHTLTLFMKFKGGKGVATAFGMLMALLPTPTLCAFGVFVVAVAISHYISVGSCLAALTIAALVWFWPTSLAVQILVTLLAVFVIYKHKSNLVRLKNGCENKIF